MTMTKRAWFMSLLLPVLSILGSITLELWALTLNGFLVCAGILGFIGGGIVPYVLMIRKQIDISQYFFVKLILFAVLAVGVTLSVTVFARPDRQLYEILILPILMIAAEVVYAARQKTDRKTKICLTLSSLAWGWLGVCLDVVIAFVFF